MEQMINQFFLIYPNMDYLIWPIPISCTCPFWMCKNHACCVCFVLPPQNKEKSAAIRVGAVASFQPGYWKILATWDPAFFTHFSFKGIVIRAFRMFWKPCSSTQDWMLFLDVFFLIDRRQDFLYKYLFRAVDDYSIKRSI